MMISGVLGAVSLISQLGQLASTDKANGVGAGGDVGAIPPAAPPPGGPMRDAIAQALAKIGVGSSLSTSSSTAQVSTQDSEEALTSFMQTLMAALHAQSSQLAAIDGGNDGNISGAGVKTTASHRHNPQSGMQSLIQQLSAPGSTGAGSSVSGTNLSALEQSFQNLLGAVGGSGQDATLANFLQALGSNMQGASPVGNVLSARA